MRANAPQLPGGGGMGAAGIDWCISFKLIGRLVSYSSSGGGLNLIRRLFQTVSELKRYICSQYVEMEYTLAEKRRNLLRYTPKPHSHALNDVIMHKTHFKKAIRHIMHMVVLLLLILFYYPKLYAV